ncbi:MAG: DUF4199 domain-containing protein [Bacteroidota bacterium]|nr:DUF4199 domain-containing protein [Bacteroidota bacterium]MDX5429432.1 DUF4199 domain-containing protein [Bacteroidota bacterium]MDX5468223.1 DUF4199 domain-containing protein [Bacteroidota bacterium]
MTRHILRFGLLAGAFIATVFLSTYLLFVGEHADNQTGMMVGYSIMSLGFILLIFGVRKIRNERGDAKWNFAWALWSGLAMMLIACSVYSLSWTVYISNFDPDWMQRYVQSTLEAMQSKGSSPSEIEAAQKEMAGYVGYYENPFMVFLITLTEPMPPGILISLITAIVFRKKA